MKNELNSIFNSIEFLPTTRYGELDLEELSIIHGDESPIYNDLYYKLNDVYEMLQYLKRPIIGQFRLYMNESGRYEVCEGRSLSSGSKLEFYYDEKWHISRVEHSDGYYIYHYPDVEMDRLLVRIRGYD